MRKHRSKRLTALVLALVLCLSLVVPVGAVGTSGGTNVRFEQVDNSVVSATLRSNRVQREQAETPLYQDTDMVRVSIVLSGKSTIEKGFATMDIAENSQAMAYRGQLQAQQETVASRISKQVLGGKKLDVVWNLTLAANIISANVPYGDIEAIKAVSGVANVVLETRYEPAVVGTDPTDPNMATSSSMIGSSAAWAEGYTGAGSRIAIIDTGTDTDHQSFDAKAFEYALEQNVKEGQTKEEYLAMLDWSITQTAHPVAIRVPGGAFVSDGKAVTKDFSKLNKYEITKQGSKVAIIGLGSFYGLGTEAAEALKEATGIEATIINPYYITGLDEAMLEDLKANHDVVITLEDGILDGGFGEKIARFYGASDMKVLNFGIKKEFLDRYDVTDVLKDNHLTVDQIVDDVKKCL